MRAQTPTHICACTHTSTYIPWYWKVRIIRNATVNVCVCTVCMNECMYVAYINICIHTCVHIHIFLHMRTYMGIRSAAWCHVLIHINAFSNGSKYVYIHIYIYIYIYIYIHKAPGQERWEMLYFHTAHRWQETNCMHMRAWYMHDTSYKFPRLHTHMCMYILKNAHMTKYRPQRTRMYGCMFGCMCVCMYVLRGKRSLRFHIYKSRINKHI
jgi:hypothetical protein